eukprot:TRINITY_DN514_c13_g1_i1.p1 TRINITY_DN514_c13_g1~~TRINITY_DN514_c13_g1_i1.p1  ORF type:complete len:163 (+),score=28.00 TRINITY_DN514_c13_g1_i1:46-489(+)
MPASFKTTESGKDVTFTSTQDGEQARVDVAGGDYMVVPIAVNGDCEFVLKVDGFGFEIGHHNKDAGLGRKLTDPLVSMIPSPAIKAAYHMAVTGDFVIKTEGDLLTISVPNFDGPPDVKQFKATSYDKFAIVLGGHVSVTLSNKTTS